MVIKKNLSIDRTNKNCLSFKRRTIFDAIIFDINWLIEKTF
jgi:hypothetical protein